MKRRLGHQVHPLATPDQPRVYDRLVRVQPLLHPRFVAGTWHYFHCTAHIAPLSVHYPRCVIHIMPLSVRHPQYAALSLRYFVAAVRRPQ